MRHGGRTEDGAAIVEMAFVLPLLVLLLIGMAEFGIAFRDWLSISTATRAGVRVGAAAGNDVDADCFILEAAAGTLVSVPIDDIQEVWVFLSDSNGNPTGTRNMYRPGSTAVPGDLLVCSAGWVQLPASNWPSTGRNVSTNNLDIMGVRIIFNHNWITNFPPFGGTSTWTDDAIMRLEPQTFAP